MASVFGNDYIPEKPLLKEIDLRRELIEACKRSERWAQKELYDSYADAMYNICFRMLQNHADAQDVLQNAFVDVFRNLNKYKYESTPGSWIKRIVINNCINFFRRKKIHFEELKQVEVVEEQSTEYNGLTVDAISEAVAQLPQGYRMVLTLYLFEGYDHQEISEILDITVSTSKTQYHRAKQKLKQILAPIAMQ